MKRVCMIVPNRMVKGGIAAVVNGYRGSQLEKDYEITYVESYKDGSKFDKLLKGICGYFHFAYVLMFHKPDVVHIHSSFGPSFYRKMPFIYMASWRKIIAQVKKSIPDVIFVLAGAGSEADEKAIKELIAEKGISDNVKFPGWVRGDTKDKLLREADVFFLPSYNEGMPMSVLDAMGYGLPVVSTNVGGIPKIVHDGENGYCCDPGNVNQFAKGITEILLDRKERKSFGEASWKIVKEGYSLEAHLNRIEQAYKQVLLMDV